MADAATEEVYSLEESPPPPAPKPTSERLVSLDALRGFDMFWIIGGDGLFHVLVRRSNWPEWAQHAWDAFRLHLQTLQNSVMSLVMGQQAWSEHLSKLPPGGWSLSKTVNTQLEHVDWEGFHFYDLIFPLFLFMAGCAIPFSLGKRRERGESTGSLYLREFRRGFFLLLLALIYNGLLQLRWLKVVWPSDTTAFSVEIVPDAIRWTGVLQRIAIGSAAAGFIYLLMRTRGQFVTLIAILVGYWALLTFVHAPPAEDDETLKDVPARAVQRHERHQREQKREASRREKEGLPALPEVRREYSEEGSISSYVDRRVLSGKGYLKGHVIAGYYGYGDNEGLLSMLPAIATAILGLLAGQWLRRRQLPLAKSGRPHPGWTCLSRTRLGLGLGLACLASECAELPPSKSEAGT